jgi:hypothetical protein
MKLKRTLVFLPALALVALMIAPGLACELQTELWAGRDSNPVGIVTVDIVGNNLHVTYRTTGDWYLVETNLAVTNAFEDIPQTKTGNPKIGHFPYKTDHDPMVTEFTYSVPLGSGTHYIAAHAVVYCASDGVYETAWGQGPTHQPFPGNSWALYFTY